MSHVAEVLRRELGSVQEQIAELYERRRELIVGLRALGHPPAMHGNSRLAKLDGLVREHPGKTAAELASIRGGALPHVTAQLLQLVKKEQLERVRVNGVFRYWPKGYLETISEAAE